MSPSVTPKDQKNPRRLACHCQRPSPKPGGSIHQFTTPASNTEATDMFMVIYGANINFDADGNFIRIGDAGFIEAMLKKVASERGMSPLKYIRSLGAAYNVR